MLVDAGTVCTNSIAHDHLEAMISYGEIRVDLVDFTFMSPTSWRKKSGKLVQKNFCVPRVK